MCHQLILKIVLDLLAKYNKHEIKGYNTCMGYVLVLMVAISIENLLQIILFFTFNFDFNFTIAVIRIILVFDYSFIEPVKLVTIKHHLI